MKESVSFTYDTTVENGRVSIHLEDVSISSVKLLLQAFIDKIDDMYADFIVNGNGVCDNPANVHNFVIDCLNQCREAQERMPQEQE